MSDIDYIKWLYQRANRKYNRLSKLGVDRQDYQELFGIDADDINIETADKKRINYKSYEDNPYLLSKLQDFISRDDAYRVVEVKTHDGSFFGTRQHLKEFNKTVEPIRNYRDSLKKIDGDNITFTLAGSADNVKIEKSRTISDAFKTDTNTANLKHINIITGVSTNASINNLAELKQKTGYYKTVQTSVYGEKFNRLKENWLVGIDNKFGTAFADKVKKVMNDVTNREFLFLFYKTEAFTFDFIYSQDDVDAILNAVGTTIEMLNEEDTLPNEMQTEWKKFKRVFNWIE